MVKQFFTMLGREASYAGKPLLYAGRMLLNFFYPPSCPGCGLPMTAATGICHRCRILLTVTPDIRRWSKRTDFSYCTRSFFLSEVTACWEYSSVLGRIIQSVKYGGRPRLGVWMGTLAGERLRAVLQKERCDLVLPVPLHPSRKRERGYNQSGMIARGLASHLEIPVTTGILVRVRQTVTQTALSGEERQFNMDGAFRVRDLTAVAGKNVLVVDDVVTTGATMNSAAAALIDAGAQRVYGAALARPVLDKDIIR